MCQRERDKPLRAKFASGPTSRRRWNRGDWTRRPFIFTGGDANEDHHSGFSLARYSPPTGAPHPGTGDDVLNGNGGNDTLAGGGTARPDAGRRRRRLPHDLEFRRRLRPDGGRRRHRYRRGQWRQRRRDFPSPPTARACASTASIPIRPSSTSARPNRSSSTWAAATTGYP